jgi:plastocyanin
MRTWWTVAAALEATVQEEGGQPLADAVVSLVPLDGSPPALGPSRASMDQVDKQFAPHVLPVPVGTAISFPNHDNIRHHVYSFSPAKRFELPLYIGTPASPVVFDKPGVVTLGCNIHDWMLGYVYVLVTPWFAKTGDDGRARLADVPPGSYEARVWHPRLRGTAEKTGKPMTLAAGEPGQVSFVVSLRSGVPRPPPPGGYEKNVGGS